MLFASAFLVTVGLVAARLVPWSAALGLAAVLPAAGVLRDLIRAPDGSAVGKLAVVERTAKVHAVYGGLVFVSLMVWPG
jgi:1,4-dihydroxy-2-naphthoate octaprenyltransferase